MTGAYQRFAVSLKTVDRALSNPHSDEWLDDEIRSRHGLRSLQRSDKIREAVGPISDDNLWLLISREVRIDIKAIWFRGICWQASFQEARQPGPLLIRTASEVSKVDLQRLAAYPLTGQCGTRTPPPQPTRSLVV